ncbi:MAG: hypothetical protein OHK0029_35170 [Armatimonadaceae bacterium]
MKLKQFPFALTIAVLMVGFAVCAGCSNTEEETSEPPKGAASTQMGGASSGGATPNQATQPVTTAPEQAP